MRTNLVYLCGRYFENWRLGLMSFEDVNKWLGIDLNARVIFDGAYFGIWWDKTHNAMVKIVGKQAVIIKYC